MKSEGVPATSALSYRRVMARAMIVPIILLFMVMGFLFLQMRNLMTSMRWVDHTDQVIGQVNRIRFDAVAMQNRLERYVDDHQLSSLQRYQAAQRDENADVATLQAMISDNKLQEMQANELRSRILDWNKWGTSALQDRASQRRIDEGRALLDSIQSVTVSIVQAEEELRGKRTQEVQQRAETSIALTATLTIALGLILAYFMRRQLRELAQIHRESQEAASRLAAQDATMAVEARYRQLVESIKDYAIIMLDTEGRVTSWTREAEIMKGYKPEEIIGKHFSVFYPPEDSLSGKAAVELETAAKLGRFEDENWRVRKDGTQFWANVILVPLLDHKGNVTGYGKVTRDLSHRKKIEDDLKKKSIALTATNKELEAFSYAVSHDLRAPLRGIDGFSQALMEDYGSQLDKQAFDYLKRIRAGVQRMGRLIDDLLNLSRLTRNRMQIGDVDLSATAHRVVNGLREANPKREVEVVIQDDLHAQGDAGLLSAALENLLSNAWKFTSKVPHAKIEFGAREDGGERVYFVKDNGAGFDMAYSDKLFGAFQRLHSADDFQGTGVGLATVRRVILRHGGKIWAEAKEGQGAAFYFTLNAVAGSESDEVQAA